MKHQLVLLELDRAVFFCMIDKIKLFHFTLSKTAHDSSGRLT